MRRPVTIECAANFSEGRQSVIVDAIEAEIARQPDVAVLHRTMDPDHNRCVITFAGHPAGVLSAAVGGVSKAAELIDLNGHRGVHPRVGAADVIPLIPIEGITLSECASLAWELGERIWNDIAVPVYFYEAAARSPGRKRLEDVRRGEFEGLRAEAGTAGWRIPDIGGPHLHPKAGAVIVGARKLLIAWNVNLATGDLQIARRIAKAIRASSGGFPHVKALGLALETRGQVQVSMNLTDFEMTPMHRVYDTIRLLAAEAGTEIAGTEIIGLIPRAAIEAAASYFMKLENFDPRYVLEQRIGELLP